MPVSVRVPFRQELTGDLIREDKWSTTGFPKVEISGRLTFNVEFTAVDWR